MSQDVEKLRRIVGQVVRAVALEVQFYSVETRGSLAGATIRLANGARFAIGCAGDGSVSILRSPEHKGSAPGYVAEWRAVEWVSGELRGVGDLPHALRLKIGSHDLLFRNEDDELSVTVDGKAIPEDVFTR